MAKVLEFQGEIGWDLWPSNVRDSLASNRGEDLTIRFSSVGGDIFDGADIINILTDHKTDNPGIKMNLEIKGVAASMGSAIAAAPVWDDVAVSPISGYMIHNPWNIVAGDFREMESNAAFLRRATENFKAVYVKRSSKSSEEITILMNSTTWFFGEDIVSNGFADRVIESSETQAEEKKDGLMMKYKNQFSKMIAHQKELKKSEKFDDKKAAACFRSVKMAVPDFKQGAKLIDTPWSASASETRWRDHVGVESSDDLPKDNYTKRFAYFDENDAENFGAYKFPHWDFNQTDGEFINIAAVRNGLSRLPGSDIPEDEKPRVETLLRRYLDKFTDEMEKTAVSSLNNPVPTGTDNTEDSKVKDKKELIAELPEVYSESVNDGVMKERDRVKALSAMKKQDEYKDIPEVLEVIDKAIEEGTEMSAVQPLMMAAMMKVIKDPARMAAIESPGEIAGGDGGDEATTTHVEA